MPATSAPTVDRLAELVAHLSGVPGEAARDAVAAALAGSAPIAHDPLLEVAEALVTVRRHLRSRRDDPVESAM